MTPTVATAGSMVTVQVRGTNLDGSASLWSPRTGLSAASVLHVRDEGYVEAVLKVPRDVGRYPVRLITAGALLPPIEEPEPPMMPPPEDDAAAP